MSRKRRSQTFPGDTNPADVITFRMAITGHLELPPDITAVTMAAAQLTIGDPATDHLFVDNQGIQLRDGAVVRGKWDTDGDVLIGSDISSPGTTYLSIFANAQSYNGESMGAGDMLIGDNSSSKANILWDKSEGQLLFRGGTTTAAVLDTDGSLTAGSGEVVLDASGITINNKAGLATDDSNAYKFANGSGTITSGVYGTDYTAGATTINQLFVLTVAETDHLSNLYVSSNSGSGKQARLALEAFDAADRTQLDLYAGGSTPGIVMTTPASQGLTCDIDFVLLPRVTTTERDALTAANGMIVYNTTNARVEAYEGGSWVDL